MMRTSVLDALSTVFHNNYVEDRSDTLDKIVSLVGYYGDENIPEEVRIHTNKLISFLVKYELIKKNARILFSRGSTFDFNPRGQSLNNFTFSPTVNLPETSSDDFRDILLIVQKELENIDIVSIQAYVRKKAIEAGDLTPIIDFSAR